jgi:hypothetical protein
MLLTANEIKEQLSHVYVRAIASCEGFVVERVAHDRDSVDVWIEAHGGGLGGTRNSPRLGVQLKSTAMDLDEPWDDFAHDLPVKNYNDLVKRYANPRIVVVLVLPKDERQWLTWTAESLVLRRCAYWCSLFGKPPTANEYTCRVRFERARVFDGAACRALLQRVAREEDILP